MPPGIMAKSLPKNLWIKADLKKVPSIIWLMNIMNFLKSTKIPWASDDPSPITLYRFTILQTICHSSLEKFVTIRLANPLFVHQTS